MSKSKPKLDSRALPTTESPEEANRQLRARSLLRPSVNAVMAIDSYKNNLMGEDIDLATMVETLQSTIKDVKGGDLGSLEAMLVAQATTLQTMFTSLARRAANQEHMKNTATFMTLALKAQAQSRATISALVDLKYPRQATFIKQANVAHGPQQVNNGPTQASASSHEKKIEAPQTELLEADQHGSTKLDRGTTPEAKGGDSTVEAMGTVNRATNRRGKGRSIT